MMCMTGLFSVCRSCRVCDLWIFARFEHAFQIASGYAGGFACDFFRCSGSDDSAAARAAFAAAEAGFDGKTLELTFDEE